MVLRLFSAMALAQHILMQSPCCRAVSEKRVREKNCIRKWSGLNFWWLSNNCFFNEGYFHTLMVSHTMWALNKRRWVRWTSAGSKLSNQQRWTSARVAKQYSTRLSCHKGIGSTRVPAFRSEQLHGAATCAGSWLSLGLVRQAFSHWWLCRHYGIVDS